MTATAQPSHHLSRMNDAHDEPMASRMIPIMTSTPTIQTSAPSPGDPMEITTPTGSSPPSARTDGKLPSREANGDPASTPLAANGSSSASTSNHKSEHASNPASNATSNASNRDSASPPESSEPTPTKAEPNTQLSTVSASAAAAQIPAAAAPAVHQPKIVQTAFIHKLYNMLEDPNIQHLISWSGSQESFVMSPTNDFSKVLAQYFKHTNISSFVRQLNMYGFHKVSDVFANGVESTTLWEFKHGNGNFKRGDLVGLREIKRRASRHALVHKDYSNPQRPPPPSSQPGTPAEAMPIPDGSDPRVSGIDHAFYNIESRLQRNEEAMHYMHVKHQAAMDTITRLLQSNQEMARIIMQMVPPADSHLQRDVVTLQNEIQRQTEMVRGLDESHEPPYSSSRPYFANVDNAPVSPRQMPQDDPRRANLNVPGQQRQPNFYRPPVPSNLSISTRRPYGSISGPTQPSPSSVRPQQHPPPPPPPSQHPLANVDPSPNMARRHTAADIRAHGWQPTNPQYPLPGTPGGPPLSQAHYPPSPSRAIPPEDQRIRESFSTYSLQPSSRPHSRPTTPPPTLPPFGNVNGSGHSNGNGVGNGEPNLSSWSWASANRSSNNLNIKDSSAPPTRRGSMAHILNPPSDSMAERPEEGGSPREEERKRKRMV